MSNPERVMLLIDADNVSIDIMEQAIRLLLNQHGGLHVRRAYCTAESAVKHQAAFKRLGIKPMVNLAAGKNSTDIALAVDAIDLVLAERPDVVVIASSDSDFAPLVQRLREKGCVVRGIGQKGKTGDETQDVYDDYTVLEHHKSESTTAARKAPPRKAATRKTAVAKAPAAKKVATKRSPSKKAASAEAAAAAAPAVPAGPAEDAQPAGRRQDRRPQDGAQSRTDGADARGRGAGRYAAVPAARRHPHRRRAGRAARAGRRPVAGAQRGGAAPARGPAAGPQHAVDQVLRRVGRSFRAAPGRQAHPGAAAPLRTPTPGRTP
jgi:uncharacterized protein (TIGR00288 family)